MNIANLTPKVRFQQSRAAIEAHRRMIESPAFDMGVDFALMEYQRILALSPGTFNDAAANHFKVTGAIEFVRTMRELGEMPAHVLKTDQDNLKHKA